MDLKFSPEDNAFRAEIRAWLAENLAAMGHHSKTRAEKIAPEYRRAWEDHVCRSGWADLSWPREFGGKEMPIQRQVIFWEEYGAADAPIGINQLAHGILGPTLIVHGTEAQKRRFLPKINSNEEIWCQGYSEPGAGSDLAALRTRAERRGDVYVVNGQKVWTSLAQYSDWCFVLVRTDANAAKHKGISFLLVDMKTQGIEVRPLRQITGESDFNEVFFNDVEVPVDNIVGAENGGWEIAMAAASFERGTYFIPRQVRLAAELTALIETARRTIRNGRALIEDSAIRDRIVRLHMDVTIMRQHSYRTLSALMHGAVPGPEASFTKLFWSETSQRLQELGMDIIGADASLGLEDADAADGGRWQYDFLRTRSQTILAGTSEIQRNIISERTLGMPR